MPNLFFVFDTNCFISANLIENSTNAKAFDKAIKIGTVAISEAIITEYTEVLYRKKLDKYLNDRKRKLAIKFLEKNSVFFNPTETIHDCRDKKDNMFLELAVACKASCIVSGDPDLLVLNPFREIPILNASDFLKSF